MSSAAWRAVLLSLCAFSAFVAIIGVLSDTGMGGKPPWSGVWRRLSDYAPFGYKVAAVVPGGPFDRAGVHAGDTIDLRANTLQERYWLQYRALNGRAVTVLVRRGGQQKKLRLVAAPYEEGPWSIEAAVLALWLAFFATLIAWRRSQVAEMRMLAFILLAQGVNIWIAPNFWTTPWLWASIALDFSYDLTPAILALWVTLAGMYARPLSPGRRIAHWATYAIIAVQVGLGVAGSVGFVTLWYNWNAPAFATPNPLLSDAGSAGALLCTLLAIQASRGAERRRCAWTLLPLAVLLIPVVSLVRLQVPVTSYALNDIFGDVQTALQFLAPVTLTYAALSRRIIDIGFVLNQAAIFSIVSIVVVGLFMLGESVLGTWFSHMTHMTSVEITAVLALCLGFSVRAIHARVERVLDRVFFRKRHEDETAIRSLAEEALDATDAATLVRRTRETLEAHTDATFVTVLQDDGSGRYGDASSNDAAIVALHERHGPLDLATLSTKLQGDVAYPMSVRGKLVGAIVLGPRRSGESYAPDESHAIMQLAREVGAALHNLTLAKIIQEHHLPA